jgi:hypothetical protein
VLCGIFIIALARTDFVFYFYERDELGAAFSVKSVIYFQQPVRPPARDSFCFLTPLAFVVRRCFCHMICGLAAPLCITNVRVRGKNK